MSKILSNFVYIDKSCDIETYLDNKYGNIIRWAIVEVSQDKYKIAFSYEVKEA